MTGGPLSPEAIGVVLAALSALAWSSHYLFVRVGLDGGEVSETIVIALVTNLVLIVPASVVYYWPALGLTPRSVALFALAGIGTGLFARVFRYESTRRIGASRTAPITASAGLVSTVLAVLVLDELLTPSHLAGIVFIVAGVMVTSWETASDRNRDESLRDLGVTLALPFLTAVLYGVEPVIVKLALAEGTPFLIGMSIMILAAATSFLGYRRLRGALGIHASLVGPHGKWYLAAAVAGTVTFITYFAALDIAPVVFVIPITQTTPLLVAGLSLAFLPQHLERVTWRLGLSAALVVVGATLVSLAA